MRSLTITLTSCRRRSAKAGFPLEAVRASSPSRWKVRATDSKFARSSSTTSTVALLLGAALGSACAWLAIRGSFFFRFCGRASHPGQVFSLDVLEIKPARHLGHLGNCRIELRRAALLEAEEVQPSYHEVLEIGADQSLRLEPLNHRHHRIVQRYHLVGPRLADQKGLSQG